MVGYVVLGVVALLGSAALLVVRAVRTRRPEPAPDPAGLVGALGTVVTRIPDEGVGEVTLTTAGQRLKLEARAENPIRTGTTVVVVDAEPAALVVAESGF
jgi:membrane-bound ClpP family serine protease